MSWNEIRQRAIAFSHEWKGTTEERAEAHQNLDRAVDRCYRKEKFETERERVEFLFGLYEELT